MYGTIINFNIKMLKKIGLSLLGVASVAHGYEVYK